MMLFGIAVVLVIRQIFSTENVCPNGTTPYRRQGAIVDCVPGESTCPLGGTCYYNGLRDRYICCIVDKDGVAERPVPAVAQKVTWPNKIAPTCPQGESPLRHSGSAKRCFSNSDCPKPFACKGSADGQICCLQMGRIEPPPVGCPWGSRPLKDANSKNIHCTPDQQNACPGDTLCYFDTVSKLYYCCGKDPGRGCPQGAKPLLQNGQIVNCLPGELTNQCPRNTMCHWNYLTDRYQCCQKDSGCPDGMEPLFRDGGFAQKCKRDLTGCPPMYSCNFNFWIADYQCCTKSVGRCPEATLAYVDPISKGKMTCVLGGMSTCPADYACLPIGMSIGLCCGKTGQCPVGSEMQTDQTGKAIACLPNDPGTCRPPGACLPATGGARGQHLCCFYRTTIVQPLPPFQTGNCPAGYTLEDGLMKLCNIWSNTCKPTSACLQSPGQSNLFICCQSTTIVQQTVYQCPAGFSSVQQPPVLCTVFPTNCPQNSLCLSSVTNQAIKLCCVPLYTSQSHCPAGFGLQNNQLIDCRVGAYLCLVGAQCLQSISTPSLSVCCVKETMHVVDQCPPGFCLQRSRVHPCTPGAVGQCDAGSMCLMSASKDKFLCCTPAGAVQPQHCPVGWALESGEVRYCTPYSTVSCNPASSCLPAVGQANAYVCCVTAINLVKQYSCPVNMALHLVNNNPVLCSNQAMPCPERTFCVPAANDPQVHVCCRYVVSPIASRCSDGSAPYKIGLVTVSCDIATNSPCPTEYSCQRAVDNPNENICCRRQTVARYQCRDGSSAYMVDGWTYQCSPSAQRKCPPPYSCTPSLEAPSTFVCCLSAMDFKCPSRFESVQSADGTNVFCHTASDACPTQSQCLASVDDPQVRVCCKPSSSDAFCPASMQPLYINGQVQFCFGPSSSCPVSGYTCVASPVLINQFVCCRTDSSQSAEKCQNGQPAYRPSTVPFYCDPTLQQCPADYACLASEMAGRFLCCLSTNVGGQLTCPSLMVPYPDFKNPQICSRQFSNCPTGSSCEPSNVPSTFICCSASTAPTMQCPEGWTSAGTVSTIVRCNGLMDLSCPTGSTCTLSKQMNGYLCCRMDMDKQFGCSNGATPLLLSSGKAQLCTPAAPLCPQGYLCQLSTLPNTYICCKDQVYPGNFRCPNGGSPLIRDGLVYKCDSDAACPLLYRCVTAVASAEQVCCPVDSTASSGLCGAAQQVYLTAATPQSCQVSNPTCPNGYLCQQGEQQAYGAYYCCQAAVCSGQTLLNNNGKPVFCNPTFSKCPSGSFCQESSNLRGNYVCCMPSGGAIQLTSCIGRETYTATGVKQCSPYDTCPLDYECSSFTTTGQSICCASVNRTPSKKPCLSGDPYRDPLTKEFHYCSKTNYACPQGFVCKEMIRDQGNFEKYICCSAKPTCQLGWLPHVDQLTNRPHRCYPTDANACVPPGAPYRCQQSTVPGEYLCCIESKLAMSDTKRRPIVQRATSVVQY